MYDYLKRKGQAGKTVEISEQKYFELLRDRDRWEKARYILEGEIGQSSMKSIDREVPYFL